IYVVGSAGGRLHRIAKTGLDSHPVWSPDSRTIALVRHSTKKGERAQIFAYDVATGRARQLTRLKSGAGGPVYSHDGKHIVFGSVSIDAPHLAYVDFRAAGFPPKKTPKKSDVRIVKHLFFEDNGVGYVYDRHAHLRVMDANGTHARALTAGNQWSERNPHWSPDDKIIAFDSLRRESVNSGPNDVYTIPAAGGAMQKLPSSQPVTNLLNFDRSGQMWTFRSGFKNPAQLPALVQSASAGAQPRVVVPENTVDFGDAVLADMGEPGGLCGAWFAPADAFAILDENRPGYSAIVKLDPQTGHVTPLTSSGESAGCTMDARGQRVALTYSDFTHPREVYVLDTTTRRKTRLTSFNDAYLANADLSVPQEFSVKDDAGFDVQAWFMPAVGPKARGKRPTILDIHGGPQTQFGSTFFHELQYWAGQGYNVVFSDPRGSVGHGQRFEAGLTSNWGDAMFDDVQRVMDAAVTRPQVDPNRLAVSGGSYGGYATLWVISHTTRYKAAIAERVVSNLTSEELVADFAGQNGFGDFTTYGFGNPWDPKSMNYTQSPLTYVENVHTPLMMIHGDEDTRTPIDQTLQEYTALKILGRPVEYVAFPGENHDLSRTGSPLHRVERLRIESAWFGEHLHP
ncbi:MAG: S9 family peptidase, partial [Candidatus Eremiobacteraeota bacterium]|nr:S9 family peptidase [Candidatus Eremiobacteraeota bacterium]